MRFVVFIKLYCRLLQKIEFSALQPINQLPKIKRATLAANQVIRTSPAVELSITTKPPVAGVTVKVLAKSFQATLVLRPTGELLGLVQGKLPKDLLPTASEPDTRVQTTISFIAKVNFGTGYKSFFENTHKSAFEWRRHPRSKKFEHAHSRH